MRKLLKLDGSGESYRIYFAYQGYMVMIILALAGSILIGNDLRFGSLPFYLSKPLSRWHYLVGKALAVAVFVNMMTTLPAVVLFVQYGLLEDRENYFVNNGYLLAGILAYGAGADSEPEPDPAGDGDLGATTVPLIMIWTTIFLLLPRAGAGPRRTLAPAIRTGG